MNTDELFQQYMSAFNALDAEAISHCYTLPCATNDGDGQHVYSNRDTLTEKFRENCLTLKATNYKAASYSINELKPLGANTRAVDITWNIQFESNEIAFNALYMVKKYNDSSSSGPVNRRQP